MILRNNMTPAIVLSGHTMALGVVRALGKMGVPVIVAHREKRDTAHLSRYCACSIISPNPVLEEDSFIEFLVESAPRFGRAVLFPASDETVVAVSRHKELLEHHYFVACPDWNVASLFIDKKRTYALAEAIGVLAPASITPSSLEEVRACADRIPFPCLVKPCQSHLFYEHFRRKMFCVRNKEEMISVYKQAAAAGLEVMLQEIIPGDDACVVNYNSYFCNGTAALEFTAAHVRNAPPMWGSTRVAVSRDIPEVLIPGRSILRALGFEGYACTEFKRDSRDGSYKLMEVNGRHNLSTLLAVRCGVNFPWLHYRHLAYGEVPSQRPARTGIYWIDLTRDLGYSARYFGYEHYSPVQYLAPYLRPHIFAILDWKDPRPFVKRCSFLAWEGLCRLVQPLRRCLPTPGARKATFNFLGRLFKI